MKEFSRQIKFGSAEDVKEANKHKFLELNKPKIAHKKNRFDLWNFIVFQFQFQDINRLIICLNLIYEIIWLEFTHFPHS